MAAEKHGPLDQFTIHRWIDIDLGGFDASFTNSAFMMCIAVIVITLLMTLGMGRGRLVPSRLQSVVELSYEKPGFHYSSGVRFQGGIREVGPEGRAYGDQHY